MPRRRRSRIGSRAWFIAVTAAAALLVALPSVASASLWLVLDRSVAMPGDQVQGETGGTGAFGAPARGRSLLLYLAASGHEVEKPSDPALIAIGQLMVDGQGNGSTVFRVPAQDAGDYELILDCPPCEPFSAGRRMIPVGALRIVANPNTALANEAPWVSEVGVLLLLLGLCLVLRQIGHPRPPPGPH